MLVVKIEIWPGGHEERATEIRRIEIYNKTNLQPISDYGMRVFDMEYLSELIYEGEVKRHKRSLGAMKLLQRVLNKINRGK